ncbi:MAG: PocR ligand-binding domain-containing protein [Thermodesulfobacteriota bacterium]
MELTDVLPVEDWAEFEKEMYEKSGMRPRVYNVDGMGITEGVVYSNELCTRIQSIPKAQTFICAVAQSNLAMMARNSREPVVGECDAGFFKVVVPIFVGDEFIGTAGACGKLPEGGEVESFMINSVSGIPEEEIKELAGDLPSATQREMEEFAAYIQKRLDEMIRS